MSSVDLVQVVCPHCQALNRAPKVRLDANPVCGKCKQQLISHQPVVADDFLLARLIEKSDLPVVVDFWAPWCGPCQQFAPVYSQVADELAGQLIFVKLDTESHQQSAMKYQIRSIPTLAVFYRGREVNRLSGALPKSQFQQWLGQSLSQVR